MSVFTGYPTLSFTDMVAATLPGVLPKNPKDIILMMPKTVCAGWEVLLATAREGSAGKSLEVYLTTGTGKKAKATRYFNPGAERTGDLNTGTAVVTFKYAHSTFQYSFVRDQIMSQKGGAKKVDEMTRIVAQQTMSFIDGVDDDVMEMPTYIGQDTNPVQLLGLPYHLPFITSAQAATSTASGAFQGANPTGFADYGGLDRSLAANAETRTWNAYWGTSDGSWNEETIMRISEMQYRLGFKSPTMLSEYNAPGFNNFKILSGITPYRNGMKYCRTLKDTLGNVMSDATELIIGKRPVTRVESLDDNAYLPMYWYNMSEFQLYYDPQQFFLVNKVTPSNQPDVVTAWTDIKWQLVVRNPQQAGGVLSLAI